MKSYELEIPIGELFKFLNVDNNLYECVQVSNRNVEILTPSNEYTPILAYVKKQGPVEKYMLDNGTSILCDKKHLVKQVDNSFKFIKDSKHVIQNNKEVKIINTEYLGNRDVYDISINYPHEYITTSGIICHNTTIAKIIVNAIDCDYMYINASDENSVDTIRNKVKGFASTIGFKSLKVVILDESDFITPNGQAALRNLMETFSLKTRFILTCNYVEKIIEPIQSRCQVFQVIPPSKSDVAAHLVGILEKENVTYKDTDIVAVINAEYPDIRKCINTLQSFCIDGEIQLDKQSVIESNYLNKILEILTNKKISKEEKFKKIRQIIADSKVRTFENAYRFLYDNLDSLTDNAFKQSAIILNLAQSQYEDSFVVDKEIGICAMFIKIIEELK